MVGTKPTVNPCRFQPLTTCRSSAMVRTTGRSGVSGMVNGLTLRLKRACEPCLKDRCANVPLMTPSLIIRPVLACLAAATLSACGMVDADPHRFESMAAAVAAIPLDGQGEA